MQTSGVKHLPVMAREIIEILRVGSGKTYLDCTLGAGGHAKEILGKDPGSRVVGLDVDEDAIAEATRVLSRFGERIIIARGSYVNAAEILKAHEIGKVDGAIMDFGVSSIQFDTAERGFSFLRRASLDMRMDKGSALTAADIVNTYTSEELENIFREYGEEKKARAIARTIVGAREEKPIETTTELAAIVERVVAPGGRKYKIHPATRVFQAIRIAVNAELDNVKNGLKEVFSLLKPEGRLAVISFHSLEDRIVKEYFRGLISPCACPRDVPVCACGKKPLAIPVTKKALTANEDEVQSNPRARSAKLRAVERI